MGSGAGGAGRRAHYDYERATARRGRLPESLGCTTDYRHETGAPRRTPPRSAAPPPAPPPAPPAPPPHRFIHSVHNYSYGLHDGREQRAATPRERAARARAPPHTPTARAPPRPREHAHRAPRQTTPVHKFQTLSKLILIIKFQQVKLIKILYLIFDVRRFTYNFHGYTKQSIKFSF